MLICFYTVMRQTSFKGFSTIIIEKYSFRYIDYVLSMNNSRLSASHLSKRLKDTADTQKSAYYLNNSSWNRQLWNIKNKTLRQTRWLYFSHSQLPLFQDHPRIEFTFHNSYVILWSVIFWTELSWCRKNLTCNATTLLLCWSHSYKYFRSSSRSGWPLRNIYISNDNGSLPLYAEFPFLYHWQDFYLTKALVNALLSRLVAFWT